MGCLKLTYYPETELKTVNAKKELTTKISSQNACSSYLFGFNGKENDNEVKGDGNSVDFGARIYDSRLGRWLSCDPMMHKYSAMSPYNYVLDNPIMFVDENGKWPGVTFMFFELEAGLGVSYGLNYIEQSGIAWDEVGKTHFTLTSAIYVVNQNLKEGSTNPQLVYGISGGLSGGLTQNWSRSTFREYLDASASDYSVPGPEVKGKLGVGVGFNADSFTLSLGLQAGVKVSVVNTSVKLSISLTDDEADIVNDATDVWTETWMVCNPKARKDKQGNVLGYEATVATKDTKGNLIDTGVKIYSKAVKDAKGNTSSNNTWFSLPYVVESIKAEKEE